MKYTQEAIDLVKKKLVDFMNKNDTNCIVCKSHSWELNNVSMAMLEYLPVGGPVAFPTNNLTCNTCGYVMFFSAVKLGLVNSDGTPAPLPATHEKPSIVAQEQ